MSKEKSKELEALNRLETMAEWYVEANNFRDNTAQERLEEYIKLIKQALTPKRITQEEIVEDIKNIYLHLSILDCGYDKESNEFYLIVDCGSYNKRLYIATNNDNLITNFGVQLGLAHKITKFFIQQSEEE